MSVPSRSVDRGRGDTRLSPDGMRRGDQPILPLWLRCGVLALVLATFCAVLLSEPMSENEANTLRGERLVSRALFFRDGPDGIIRILDASAADPDAAEVLRLAPGEDGFIRSVMRGLARERRLRGIGQEQPFVLGAFSDGRLYIDDPATEREVVVTAFGPDNVKAFARLLPHT